MAINTADKAIPITLQELAVITVANNKDVVTLPFDCQILGAHMYLGTTGTTSGNNDATVTYTAPSGAAISSSGDLWTVASGVGRIAYNASAKYLEWTASSFNKTYLEAGGTLALNVTSVASAGSPANLVVTLWVVPVND